MTTLLDQLTNNLGKGESVTFKWTEEKRALEILRVSVLDGLASRVMASEFVSRIELAHTHVPELLLAQALAYTAVKVRSAKR